MQIDVEVTKMPLDECAKFGDHNVWILHNLEASNSLGTWSVEFMVLRMGAEWVAAEFSVNPRLWFGIQDVAYRLTCSHIMFPNINLINTGLYSHHTVWYLETYGPTDLRTYEADIAYNSMLHATIMRLAPKIQRLPYAGPKTVLSCWAHNAAK